MGAKIESLNQYIVWTIPFEIVGFVPVILYRIGWQWDNRLMLIHPGCSVMQLLEGKISILPWALGSIIVWSALLFAIAKESVDRMFRISGEIKM